MTKTLIRQTAIFLTAIAFLLAPLSQVLSSVASETSDSYHWARQQTPFTLQAGNNMSGSWNSLLRQAISEWNKGDVVILKEASGETGAQNCAARDGTVQVCNWKYGTQEGWLGLTRLFFNDAGDHVDSATVQMNDSFFDQSGGQYNSDAARRHTICHEMGHAIGLDHVDTTSCMNNSQYAVFNYVTPINKDYKELARIYQHKDSTTTVAGNQKKDKKNKDKKTKKGKKNKKGKNQKAREARRSLNKRNRAEKESTRSSSFFDPTVMPGTPSGLTGDETVTIEHLDDGRTVVSFITWANQ